MISKAERQHILSLKQWSSQSREDLHKALEGPYGKILAKLAPEGQQMAHVVFDNVDWLIALIERESHAAAVRGLIKVGEGHWKETALDR